MNKFFKIDDKKDDKCIFDLEPNFWWSRLYEYKFCLDMVESDDIVLDLCCGTYHPFKFALIDKCKEVYACDIDNLSKESILNSIDSMFGKENLVKFNEKLIDEVKLKECDITKLEYEDNKFNKIFCISALEHMDLDIIEKGLNEAKRVLKEKGKIILTLDFPTLLPEKLIEIINKVGLVIDGEYDYSIPNDAIKSTYFGGELTCYNIMLKKKEIQKVKGKGKKVDVKN